jgi:hypothetical protein
MSATKFHTRTKHYYYYYYYYYYHHHHHHHCLLYAGYLYIFLRNNVPKQYNVAAILSLLFMVPISLVHVLTLMYFYISTLLLLYYYYYYYPGLHGVTHPYLIHRKQLVNIQNYETLHRGTESLQTLSLSDSNDPVYLRCVSHHHTADAASNTNNTPIISNYTRYNPVTLHLQQSRPLCFK